MTLQVAFPLTYRLLAGRTYTVAIDFLDHYTKTDGYYATRPTTIGPFTNLAAVYGYQGYGATPNQPDPVAASTYWVDGEPTPTLYNRHDWQQQQQQHCQVLRPMTHPPLLAVTLITYPPSAAWQSSTGWPQPSAPRPGRLQ